MLDIAKVKARREFLGMTFAEAAARAGLGSRQAWDRIESGRGKSGAENLNLATLAEVAAALAVHPFNLLVGPPPGRPWVTLPPPGAVPVLNRRRLAVLRRRVRIEIETAAALAGVDAGTWRELESGRWPRPRLATVWRIAAVFGVDPRSLLVIPRPSSVAEGCTPSPAGNSRSAGARSASEPCSTPRTSPGTRGRRAASPAAPSARAGGSGTGAPGQPAP